jgi:hypothetical protein
MKQDDKQSARRASGRKVRHWIFQANPARYRIHDSLAIESEEWWNLNQHAASICVGDSVAIWISGSEAGVYALGVVTEGPVIMPDSIRGQGYWQNSKDGLNPKPRVRVRYDQVFFDRPLLKVFLEANPDLWDLSVIRAPRGTNFPMLDEEWYALQSWLKGDDKTP